MLYIGCQVQIIIMNGEFKGRLGIIRQIEKDEIFVELLEAAGSFWFNPKDLVVYPFKHAQFEVGDIVRTQGQILCQIVEVLEPNEYRYLISTLPHLKDPHETPESNLTFIAKGREIFGKQQITEIIEVLERIISCNELPSDRQTLASCVEKIHKLYPKPRK